MTVLPVVPPDGRFHTCAAESVQVSSSSCALGLPPGSVRHSPEFGLTSSPLDSWVQSWAGEALQAYQSISVPLVVPAATTSRHPPCVRRVPSVYGDHCWPASPSQESAIIGLPSVFSALLFARHSPPSPVTCPVAVAVPVGVEFPPSS